MTSSPKTSPATFGLPVDPTQDFDYAAACAAAGIPAKFVSPLPAETDNDYKISDPKRRVINKRLSFCLALMRHAAELAGDDGEHSAISMAMIIAIRGDTHTHHMGTIQGRGGDIIFAARQLLKGMQQGLRRAIIIGAMGDDVEAAQQAHEDQERSN